MCEAFMVASTTMGDSEQEHEDRLQAKMFPKPNIEVTILIYRCRHALNLGFSNRCDSNGTGYR